MRPLLLGPFPIFLVVCAGTLADALTNLVSFLRFGDRYELNGLIRGLYPTFGNLTPVVYAAFEFAAYLGIAFALYSVSLRLFKSRKLSTVAGVAVALFSVYGAISNVVVLL